MKAVQRKINSEIGPLYLVASAKSLYGILWAEQPVPFADRSTVAENKMLERAEQQIREYLNGERQDFDLPLDAQGTVFQKRVWAELSKIPYGKTCSYKDIAVALGDKNASRAVGTANGQNPISIIVPCHRVITSAGTLGGYAGGLDIKEKLLGIERGSF